MSETLDYMFERLDSRVDVLTQMLAAVHLGSALSHRITLRAPWGLRFGGTNRRAGFHVVAAGRCWVRLDGDAEAAALDTGDVVVFPHGTGHQLSDHPDTPSLDVREVIGDLAPGQTENLPSAATGAPSVLLCGAYSFSADGTNPLLRGLPKMLHLRADEIRGSSLEGAVNLLISETHHPMPGVALVIDRLVDLLFVFALRMWLDQHDAATAHSWFGALQDPGVGPAVRAIHAEPAFAWSVANLAERAGLSRAAFARRFTKSVGEPPLSYVTRWRMTVAADLLAQGGSIAEVAYQAGYDNVFAFAKAFKRIRGCSPGQYRSAMAKQHAQPPGPGERLP